MKKVFKGYINEWWVRQKKIGWNEDLFGPSRSPYATKMRVLRLPDMILSHPCPVYLGGLVEDKKNVLKCKIIIEIEEKQWNMNYYKIQCFAKKAIYLFCVNAEIIISIKGSDTENNISRIIKECSGRWSNLLTIIEKYNII